MVSLPLASMPVTVSEHATTRVWHYPAERFWSYEPSPETERWCRFFGFGHQTIEPAAFLVAGRWLIHPTIYRALHVAGARK